MDWSKIVLAALPMILSNLPTLASTLAGSHPAGSPPPTGASPQTDVQRNFIRVVQGALNAAQQAGLISFGAPLVVDGYAGPRSMAAVQAILSKLGVQLPA
jgi:hypothetical protein